MKKTSMNDWKNKLNENPFSLTQCTWKRQENPSKTKTKKNIYEYNEEISQ